MKKKILKFLLTIVLLIIILSTIFFIIDYKLVTQNKDPLFCIKQTAVLDGGTQIYVGLGYKVISFNSIIDLDNEPNQTYYNCKKIGPLFMSYNDFNIEKENYKKLGNDIISYYKENNIDETELKKETLHNSQTFYAEIKEIKEELILVKGLEINDINHRSEYNITLKDYTLIKNNNQEIKKDDLKIGNIISITYTGSVKETSPALISQTYTITLISDSKTTLENSSKPSQPIKDKYNTAPNVTMEIKSGTLSQEGATLIITDKNETPFTYGAAFKLQKKINNVWKDMNYFKNGGNFISIGYLTNEDGICEIKTEWLKHYGKLSTGEYRIIKEVYDSTQEYENYEDGIRYISTEFVIE